MELLEALRCHILAEGVLHVLLVEEDMYALERCVVRSHAVVLQAGDSVHASLGHILLCEHYSEFLGSVVAVVEEDDYVALLDGAVIVAVHDGEDKLVGHALSVRLLNGLHHVAGLLALAIYEQVIGYLHALPALVAVHSVVATDDRGNLGIVLHELADESSTALRVGVASVHEAVHVSVVDAILTGDVDEFEEVVE